MNTRAQNALTYAAGAVIVVLTVAAFWLSYAHLHSVAAGHGLGMSPERAWAWPATLDLFIVSGELLMLRASLARATDPWAIGLTVIGSGGSIALNVLGVTGVDPLDYVTAAVPPTAALLAFGALMRQVHGMLGDAVDAPAVDLAPAAVAVDVDRVSTPVAELPAVATEPQAASVDTIAVAVSEPLPQVDTADGPRLSPEAARMALEDAWKRGLSTREGAELSTRHHSFAARVYRELEAAHGPQPKLSLVQSN